MKRLLLAFLLIAGVCSAGESERAEKRKLLEEKVREGKGGAADYAQLGTLLALAGENEKALEVYKEAARLEPGSAAYANNVAITYYDLDRRAEAKEWFQKAQAISPDDPRAKEYLAAIAELEANMEKARRKSQKPSPSPR